MTKIQVFQDLLASLRNVAVVHDEVLTIGGQDFEGEYVSMREAHFVVAIGLNNTYTMSELAQKLEVTAGAVSQLAKTLEERGYVVRVPSINDKRVNDITLTKKGERLYNHHVAHDLKQYELLVESFGEYNISELKKMQQFNQKLEQTFRLVVESQQ